jgi:hypothetical protein
LMSLKRAVIFFTGTPDAFTTELDDISSFKREGERVRGSD